MLMHAAFAAHPLVSDDTSTQDAGNQQFEANTDWYTKQGVSSHVADFTYSYGALPNLDVFADLPLTASSPRGINDGALGLKWRYYERGATSFAIKPAIVVATGNQNRALGTGRTGAAVTLIGTYDASSWLLVGDVGMDMKRYALSADRQSNRGNLWRASVAVTYIVNAQWRVVTDIGIARNPDVNSSINPAFLVAGVVYSSGKDVDLDVGLRFGLNRAEVSHQAGAGVTLHF